MECNLCLEIAIRLVLWILFFGSNELTPFIREIQEDEVWKYKYPLTLSYVSVHNLWVILILVPAIFFLMVYRFMKNMHEMLCAFLGITLSYGVTGIITNFLKIIVGRPRPDFYYRCFPNGKGSDYRHCTGPEKYWIDGRKSFPSGHASLGFACMVFISLHIARIFNLKKCVKSWEMLLCLLPILIATAIALSRTCDYHHHYEDVTIGGLIGTIISYICYNIYFPETI